MWRKTLVRRTECGNTRYYRLELHPTLFNEYIVEREYGNVRYRRPTGIKIDYFYDEESAKSRYLSILRQKKNKGYRDKTQ